MIFCDRFPFRYLIDELNLKYYAAFAGCSAETEASFETVAFLVKKTEELKPDSIFVTESSDKKLAQTVISGAKLPETKITVLNSMQAVTLEQAQNGASYIKIMQENLEKFLLRLNKWNNMAQLTCSNLTLGYESKIIIKNLNFSVNSGTIFALSAKTVLEKQL